MAKVDKSEMIKQLNEILEIAIASDSYNIKSKEFLDKAKMVIDLRKVEQLERIADALEQLKT